MAMKMTTAMTMAGIVTMVTTLTIAMAERSDNFNSIDHDNDNVNENNIGDSYSKIDKDND